MTLNVFEVHLVTDSDAKPIGFSSVDFKSIGGVWLGSISPQAVVRRSVVWGADVSADVYDAAVAANPNEIKGKQHPLIQKGPISGPSGMKSMPLRSSIYARPDNPLSRSWGVSATSTSKPDVFDFDPRRVVAVAREIYVYVDASGDDYKGQR